MNVPQIHVFMEEHVTTSLVVTFALAAKGSKEIIVKLVSLL